MKQRSSKIDPSYKLLLKRPAGLVVKPVRHRSHMYPLFVVGSGRSGSTLLRRLLMERYDILMPSENYALGDTIDRLLTRPLMSWRDVCRICCDRVEQTGSLEQASVNIRKFFERERSMNRNWRDFPSIFDHLYSHLSKGHARWGDKTPLNSYYIPHIQLVFPNARFIHVIRDGIDAVSSYVRSGLYDSAEAAAHRWLTSNLCIFESVRHMPSKFRSVRYEELVSKPNLVCEDIAKWSALSPRQFLSHLTYGDVELHHHHRNVLKPISTKSIGLGREDLSTAELDSVGFIIDDLNEALGYRRVSR